MASMFSLITKNFVKRPATRMYPFVVREPFERTRGRLFNKIEDCIYCGICQKACPADAIKVDRPAGTWELDAFRCITCNECVLKCPKKCLTLTNERRSSGTKKYISLQKPAQPAPAMTEADKTAVENKEPAAE